MTENKSNALPFKWEQAEELFDDDISGGINFYGVTFIEDFGNIKAGDKFNFIFLDIKNAILKRNHLNDENAIKFKLVPA